MTEENRTTTFKGSLQRKGLNLQNDGESGCEEIFLTFSRVFKLVQFPRVHPVGHWLKFVSRKWSVQTNRVPTLLPTLSDRIVQTSFSVHALYRTNCNYLRMLFPFLIRLVLFPTPSFSPVPLHVQRNESCFYRLSISVARNSSYLPLRRRETCRVSCQVDGRVVVADNNHRRNHPD